jgi:dephospho-CoA kinase
VRSGIIIGLTGGIATGKSTFLKAFAKHGNPEVFCADVRARALLDSDPEVAREIRERINPTAYNADGTPNRSFLRDHIFSNEAARHTLEEIIHPRVRGTWSHLAERCRKQNRPFVADIPLLFETGAESRFDAIICVSCSPSVQMDRLLGRPGISPMLAKKMIDSQMDAATKESRSHHVVWNDGSLEALTSQADFLARILIDARNG